MAQEQIPGFDAHALGRWAQVLLLLAVATLAGVLIDTHVSLASQAMVYVLAVAIAAYRLEWPQSAACALGAAAALNFFFVPPRFTFEVESNDNLIALGAMLIVAMAMSHLGAALRRQSQTALRNEARARQLQQLAMQLGEAGTPEAVRTLGDQALCAAFAGPVDLALTDAQGGLQTPEGMDAQVRNGLLQCLKDGAVLGPGTGRWPGLNDWYLPLGEPGQQLGAVRVAPAQSADTDGREHATALALLLGQALWRLRLNSSMLAAQTEARHQQLQTTFLAAISHDLRTPLAVILGSATTLRDQRDRLPGPQQEALLEGIVSEATYLETLAENTLQWVRLSASTEPPRRSWESIEEIVGSALARARQQDPGRRIRSRVAPGLPLVRADAVLLGQLLVNLLDNALKYSDGPVELEAAVDGDRLRLCVKDRGAGIPDAVIGEGFRPFMRGDQSAAHGAGLGLAVCRAIAQSHGGSLEASRRRGGGARVCLRLPLEPLQPEGGEP